MSSRSILARICRPLIGAAAGFALVIGSVIAAAPAQASAGGAAQASAAGFARQAYDSAKFSTAPAHAATVTTLAATNGTTAAPLPGFCTLDGISGATSFITCSIVVPATVYVLCSSGAIFFGNLPVPGIYRLTATPCFATGYALV
jgi:hypothetical protein